MSTPTPLPPQDGPAPQRPLRPFMTTLHLAAMGTMGWALLTTLVTLLATGAGLIIVMGIGLVILVGCVYALFGLGWFEVARVSGLYRLDVPALGLRRGGSGFKGYLKGLWSQVIDARMWRAVANFGIASTLGLVVLWLTQLFFWSIGSIVAGSLGLGFASMPGGLGAPGGIIAGVLGVLIAPAGILLLTMLHRTISCALIEAGAHEAVLREQVRATAEQREGAVRAADVERTRIERDLHDGVQPRLVSIGMTLGLAKQQLDSDPESAKALIDEAHTSTKAAVTELRQLARGIHASVLDDRGLDAALSALAGRSHIPVHLDVRIGSATISRDAQAAVYFAVAESLTNAAKHSRASECRVTLRVRGEAPGASTLWARVEDNGIGGATVQPGGGLDGIINRVLAAGGTSRLESPIGGPTTLEVSVPCAS
ncbi:MULTISPECIES: sensor histidine kinase [unclassified Leucobacter]|uniref:sensor histidine kinase n=1 Tax=unclassified Leucobacter TaxID=2621730 RepID=UPI00165E0458|nr:MULTISPECIES: sensor histidine kinase [unclassified Leucobacter]MBC9927730.1 sensor histidine kinase [Leucobacter sp. cx-169]